MNEFRLSGRVSDWVAKQAQGAGKGWGLLRITEETQDFRTKQVVEVVHEISCFGKVVQAAAALHAGVPVLVVGTIRARPSADGRFFNESLSADEILPLALPMPGGARPPIQQPAAQNQNDVPF